MTHRVSLSDNARSDVDEILTWLSERSQQGAVAWADRFEEVLTSLQTEPANRTKAPESEGYEKDIHQVVFKTRRGKLYRALYVIQERDVIVIHVRGPGRDLMLDQEIQMPDDPL